MIFNARALHPFLLSAFALALVCSLTAPRSAFAEDFEANKQCPPGGKIGQPCKDVTNGFVTTGRCTHINECKAEKWQKAPSAKPESTPAPKPPPGTPTSLRPVIFPTSSVSELPSDVINAAYGEGASVAGSPSSAGYSGTGRSGSAPRVPSALEIIESYGTEYIVSESGERLRVGDALAPAPQASAAGGTPAISDVFKTFAAIGNPDAPLPQPILRADAPGNGAPLSGATFAQGTDSSASGGTLGSQPSLPVIFGVFGAIVLCAGPYLFFRFTRRNSVRRLSDTEDLSERQKLLSTKDESVARPLRTGVQEKTIWEHLGSAPPGDSA